ncbi:MAG: hypothetical protein A3K10_08555 [Bacteroidetes bacterium RIFCSPLOWO2_12_FULL_31_6]|nr:MAG: hypothetical protein A3K10_08555 [Bacteroidetes bacterium RIFCSPLOWO2_12_FULL_31_6]
MKIAIMQPYVFPYIGYFQLINAVDKFIFYDDVNYIKRGWINRNRILVNNEEKLFTIPVLQASQNKLINEIALGMDNKWLKDFYSTLEQNYKKAPYYEPTLALIKTIFNQPHKTISELATTSIIHISNHLKLSTVFELSSLNYAETKGMEKADRLIEICKLSNADTYINPSGGKELYNKPYFKTKGIDLFFIENELTPYQQFNDKFVGGLSIIDVLMFNSKTDTHKLLSSYQLI